MGRIPEFTRTVQQQTVQTSNVDLARAQKDIDRQAVTQQGAIDTANLREKRQATIETYQAVRGYADQEVKAKNATAVSEGAINYRRTLGETQEALRQQYHDNPDGYAKALDRTLQDQAAATLKAAPSTAARIALKERLDSDRASVYDNNLLWERQRKTEIFADSIERQASDLNVMAYRAGQSGQPIDNILEDVELSAMAGSTIVSKDKVQNIRETMRRGIIENMLEGLASSNPYAMQKRLKSGEFDTELPVDSIQKLESKAEAEINKRKAKATVKLNSELSRVDQASDLGVKIPRDKLDKLSVSAAALDMPEKAAALQVYAETQDWGAAFAITSMETMQDSLDALKDDLSSGDLDPLKLSKLATGQKILESKAKMFADGDALSFYAAHDKVSIEPMDFSDAKSYPEQIESRRVAAQTVAGIEGSTPSLFTSTEAKQMEKIIKDAPPEQAAAIFNGLASALTPEELGTFAKTMSKQNEILGVGMAVGERKVFEKIIAGTALKGNVTTANNVRTSLTEMLSGVVASPERYEQIQASIYAAYKQNQFMDGDSSETVDSDRLDRTVNEILGPIYNVGDSKILGFKVDNKWVDESDLYDSLMGITDEKLILLNGSLPRNPADPTKTIPIRNLIDNGKFVTIGDGVYGINIVGLGYASDEKGRPYKINARDLMPLNELEKTTSALNRDKMRPNPRDIGGL